MDMQSLNRDIIPHIESLYSSFTPLEKTIADYFIHNTDRRDLSSKSVAGRLYVSEASLSRFAKKCGYQGYREFLFHYLESPQTHAREDLGKAETVLQTYQSLLTKSAALLDEEQMQRIARLFCEKKRVFVYGKGSSGAAALEMKFRFMRIGVDLEAITDLHLMKMNFVLLNPDCLVIGLSISGQDDILHALQAAKEQGAATVLVTTHRDKAFSHICDEILLCAVQENLSSGKKISPQFPILIMLDILFSHILEHDTFRREALHSSTLQALHT